MEVFYPRHMVGDKLEVRYMILTHSVRGGQSGWLGIRKRGFSKSLHLAA